MSWLAIPAQAYLVTHQVQHATMVVSLPYAQLVDMLVHGSVEQAAISCKLHANAE